MPSNNVLLLDGPTALPPQRLPSDICLSSEAFPSFDIRISKVPSLSKKKKNLQQIHRYICVGFHVREQQYSDIYLISNNIPRRWLRFYFILLSIFMFWFKSASVWLLTKLMLPKHEVARLPSATWLKVDYRTWLATR